MNVGRASMAADYARAFLGKPYLWGGDDPMAGFDCSGLTLEILWSVGMVPPGDKNAQTIYQHFLVAKGTVPEQRGLGALCFYGLTPNKITHVAFMLSDEYIIEAGGGGSSTLTLNDAIKQNAFIRVRPYRQRKDLVAVLMPGY